MGGQHEDHGHDVLVGEDGGVAVRAGRNVSCSSAQHERTDQMS